MIEVASDTLQIYYLYISASKEHKDDIGRGNFMTNQQVFCSHTSKLWKFTWQYFFVYFCLTKHLSNTAGTYLTQRRICSPPRPDNYFIFITPAINTCLWPHAYKRDRFKQLKLKLCQTKVEKLKIVLRSEFVLFSWKTAPNVFLELLNKSLVHVERRAEEKKQTSSVLWCHLDIKWITLLMWQSRKRLTSPRVPNVWVAFKFVFFNLIFSFFFFTCSGFHTTKSCCDKSPSLTTMGQIVASWS